MYKIVTGVLIHCPISGKYHYGIKWQSQGDCFFEHGSLLKVPEGISGGKAATVINHIRSNSVITRCRDSTIGTNSIYDSWYQRMTIGKASTIKPIKEGDIEWMK